MYLRASRLVSRNIDSMAGRTSMRLEPEFWDALAELCAREQTTVRDLVSTLDGEVRTGGRTSGMRVHLLRYFREAATEQGHSEAGHGPQPVPISG
jgi:predicted DNA-binding ribbon-helix-helix protein